MIDQALHGDPSASKARWSEAVAVASVAFAETVKREHRVEGMHRKVKQAAGKYPLWELSEAYTCKFAHENEVLPSENTAPWQTFVKTAET
jgi:hypothetical protein